MDRRNRIQRRLNELESTRNSRKFGNQYRLNPYTLFSMFIVIVLMIILGIFGGY
ncbi:MAG: hypothetical protein FWD01_03040 [Defluviitaleaceae bacterium]|nr:hypothetical protein [Defluviitaleaceae bacterium]